LRQSVPTDRELLVLQKIAKGMSNKEIGNELGITEGTVKAHVTNILSKLHAADRTQAVTTAIKRGIIHIE
jgi:DNA-binding NarL/FixJ family response regulator